MAKNNPYSLMSGKAPMQVIPRSVLTEEVCSMFMSEQPSQQIYMITGVSLLNFLYETPQTILHSKRNDGCKASFHVFFVIHIILFLLKPILQVYANNV